MDLGVDLAAERVLDSGPYSLSNFSSWEGMGKAGGCCRPCDESSGLRQSIRHGLVERIWMSADNCEFV